MYRHPCHRGLQRLFVTCQLHLVASGAGTPTINHTVTALRFLFIVTLRKPQVVIQLPFIREPRKLGAQTCRTDRAAPKGSERTPSAAARSPQAPAELPRTSRC